MPISPRLNILILPPAALYGELFTPEADRRLRALGATMFNDFNRNLTSTELAERIAGVDVVVTGWGSPAFSDAALAAATSLRLVAHSAGSIKFLLPDDALARGFAVTTAAAAMGQAVAEMALQLTMMALRPIHRLDAGLRAGGEWRTLKAIGSGDELSAQRVGIVGAGHIGRHVARMFRGLGVETRIYDPYLTAERSAAMDADRADSLDDLVRTCRVVTLHAPSTPQTRHMVGARELAALCDGGVLVNTARPSLVDSAALLAELRTGRISAALDVFDEEPLPSDSPLRALDNVILTPHVASHTRLTHFKQGQAVVDEIERFARGEPLRHRVTPEMLATTA